MPSDGSEPEEVLHALPHAPLVFPRTFFHHRSFLGPQQVVWTNEFKKDYKLMLKRHKDISKLDKIIEKLANEKPLLPKHKDHDLVGRFTSFRECHIEPDWLLIYKVDHFCPK
jgi:mRNA interferase YafQ